MPRFNPDMPGPDISMEPSADARVETLEKRQGELISLQEKVDKVARHLTSDEEVGDRDRAIKRLEDLEKEKDEWVKENGRENVPVGIVINAGENGREVKGVQAEGGEEKDLEARKKEIEKDKKEAVEYFEEALRNDFWTSDANNLDFCVEVVRSRVPKMIDKKTTKYVKGEEDRWSYLLWMKYRTTSLYKRLVGEQNNIIKLELYFDDTPVTIAPESELRMAEDEEKPGGIDEIKPTETGDERETEERKAA